MRMHESWVIQYLISSVLVQLDKSDSSQYLCQILNDAMYSEPLISSAHITRKLINPPSIVTLKRTLKPHHTQNTT
jgi:hypothetical protein